MPHPVDTAMYSYQCAYLEPMPDPVDRDPRFEELRTRDYSVGRRRDLSEDLLDRPGLRGHRPL